MGKTKIGIHRQAGFTLVELSVVIAILGVLAAVIGPDFIEGSRNKLAEVAIKQVSQIQDAAVFFYAKNGRWPGELGCVPNGLLNWELKQGGYDLLANPTNPWGNLLSITFGWVAAGCAFYVATNVPLGAAGTVGGLLPNSNGCPAGVCKSALAPPTDMSGMGYVVLSRMHTLCTWLQGHGRIHANTCVTLLP